MIRHFDNAASAAEYLKNQVRSGDIVLVKGSQNRVRLERLVKVLMKEPWKAVHLLPRQGTEWEKVA